MGLRHVDILEGETDGWQMATWVKYTPALPDPVPSSFEKYASIFEEVTRTRSGAQQEGESAAQLISHRIAELGDWRGETLARIRGVIKEADPDIIEEWKWMGTPVWSHNGIVCTGETYKVVVKMTFAKGASLKDPSRLFSSSLDGNVRRAIDIHEGDQTDAPALKALIKAAVALNASGGKKSNAMRNRG